MKWKKEKMRWKEGEGKFREPKDWSQIWMHLPWLHGSHVVDDGAMCSLIHVP